MALEAKYIKFDDKYNTYMIIFSNYIIHFDMVCKMGDHPVSAGFVRIDDAGNVTCYGESTSTGLKSEPEDSAIAARMLGKS